MRRSSATSSRRSAADSVAAAGSNASRRATEPLVEQVASSRAHIDAERTAVARLGRARDEAERLERVDRPAGGGGARAHPLRQVVQAERPVVAELDERDPLRRRHRRPVVGAADQAGQLADQVAQLAEDELDVWSGACHVANHCTMK